MRCDEAGRVGCIWAQDLAGAIGTGEAMAWHVPADFAHFRALTLGHALILGRRTFTSLGSRPLPGRHSIVLTSHPETLAGRDDIAVATTLPDALAQAADHPGLTWVIGGGEVYRAALDHADVLVVTTIDLVTGAGVLAPRIDPDLWAPVPAGAGPCASDPERCWRPRSGDARWRVDVWHRR